MSGLSGSDEGHFVLSDATLYYPNRWLVAYVIHILSIPGI